MSVFDFVQRHIDAVKHSMRNVESEKIYCLLYLLLEAKGKIFFTGVGKNGHVAAKAASTFSSIGLPCFYINPVDSVHGDMGVINDDDIILDIGPKTISMIEKIIDSSNTVLWNGPAGYFENPNFQNGTKEIVEIISQKTINDKIFSVAGGGETVAAINMFKKLNSFTFVSTAGGAFLEYLEGKNLPGIKALNQNV